MSMRSFEGDAIDGTYQHISERPSLEDEADDVVYATDPSAGGTETSENVPVLDEDDEPEPEPEPEPELERPVVKGQTTLPEWHSL